MIEHPNVSKAREALRNGGGLYDFEDILSAIESGNMQSFAEGETLVITRVNWYPRRVILEIVLVVGNYEDLVAIEPRIVQFAKENSCDGMMASGRDGWAGKMTEGWAKLSTSYIRSF